MSMTKLHPLQKVQILMNFKIYIVYCSFTPVFFFFSVFKFKLNIGKILQKKLTLPTVKILWINTFPKYCTL